MNEKSETTREKRKRENFRNSNRQKGGRSHPKGEI